MGAAVILWVWTDFCLCEYTPIPTQTRPFSHEAFWSWSQPIFHFLISRLLLSYLFQVLPRFLGLFCPSLQINACCYEGRFLRHVVTFTGNAEIL